MIEIVLASLNPGKAKEIQMLLQDLPIKLIPASEFDLPPIAETGGTFVENAIIKARHAAAFTGLPALADDSGLTVDCLGGAPGVLSARYAGDNASDADRIEKLLKEIGDDEGVDRSACFHCVIALMQFPEDPAPLICHGTWEGDILHRPRGTNGFGYDPIFYVPDRQCSAAELDPIEKNRISHRGQALEAFKLIVSDAIEAESE